jgi:hypothetical protein
MSESGQIVIVLPWAMVEDAQAQAVVDGVLRPVLPANVRTVCEWMPYTKGGERYGVAAFWDEQLRGLTSRETLLADYAPYVVECSGAANWLGLHGFMAADAAK